MVAELHPVNFAEALTRLLLDSACRTELSTRARAFAAGYDWTQVAPSLARLYGSVAR